MTSNEKTKNYKLVDNFLPMDLDEKIVPIGVRMLPLAPKYGRRYLDDGNPRVYIKRGNLGQRAPRKFLPLGSRLEGEINLQSSTISKEEEGAKGRCPQGSWPWPPPSPSPSSPPGCTSPSRTLPLTMSMCE